MTDVWPTVHAERRALADDLEGLPADRWAVPSLCPGWDVHDVVAHLVDTAKETRLRFVARLVAAGFDFDRANAKGVAAERAADPARTLEELRTVADRTSTPPAPKVTRLVEAFVHGEDIRRPLGIDRRYPSEAVGQALALQARTGASMGGGKERVQGVTLAAIDLDLTIGTGPRVEGPVLSLLLVTSGRTTALADLDGPGLDRLAETLR